MSNVESIYENGKVIGTITFRRGRWEARPPGFLPNSKEEWVSYGTREEALTVIRENAR